ncbi:hypothetical protein [Aetokthonos hydrillicola]|jgi:hypothetical protein|nr:hypothetical protein [Aetokthonos hydrillicola]MBO3458465.1 hypothetical protein [Aetokthonos hydrillicola CCALA 1050]MBW4586208.1 hypothetical protein [Aetokthonos hydrillicola CCALA 1050]
MNYDGVAFVIAAERQLQTIKFVTTLPNQLSKEIALKYLKKVENLEIENYEKIYSTL